MKRNAINVLVVVLIVLMVVSQCKKYQPKSGVYSQLQLP